MENKDLIVSVDMEPAVLFTEKGVETIIKGVKDKVKAFSGSIETDKERKEIASFAFKIAKTKTFLEKIGKDLVAGKKAEIKLVDNERKKLRDSLDELKTKARKPLTDYEEAEKARIEAERQLEIFNMDHEEALSMNDLFDREKSLAEKEAEMKRIEDERLAKEEEERRKKEQAEREARLKKEAAEQAKRDAEEKIRLEKERADRAEKDRIEAEKRAEEEKQAAIQRAKEEAKAKAKAEKEEEERRQAEIKAEEERKAANRNHQKRINREIVEDLTKITTLEIEEAQELIRAIVKGEIRNITINY